jgi:hypothetical protein
MRALIGEKKVNNTLRSNVKELPLSVVSLKSSD